MASVLIISDIGDGIPLAIRLSEEGHIVKVFLKEEDARESLKGYKNPSLINTPMRMLEQYDIIISDMSGQGDLCEELKEKGKLVLGGGTFNDKLELDRAYGERVVKSVLKELKTPESWTVKTSSECLDLLKDMGPAVVKPMGNKEVYYTLVSKDDKNRTLISMIQSLGDEIFPALVQSRIDGTEISTEGWFNGEQFVQPFNHTIEYKRFMEYDKGPQIGCAGNVVWTTEGDRLVEQALLPLEPLLRKVEYVGPIDVNCIVNDKGAWFLEFTPRLGYDAIQALCELMKGQVFDWFWGVATKKDKPISFHQGFALATRLSLPPYPRKEGIKDLKGVQALDIPQPAKSHVWLSDVQRPNGNPVCAGVDGVLGCVTARGVDAHECRRRVYRTIQNIVIHQDVQFRQDIGSDFDAKYKELKEAGWLG